MESLALQALRTYRLPLCLPVITLPWSWQALARCPWTGPWANLPGRPCSARPCHLAPEPRKASAPSTRLRVSSSRLPVPHTSAAIRKLGKDTEGSNLAVGVLGITTGWGLFRFPWKCQADDCEINGQQKRVSYLRSDHRDAFSSWAVSGLLALPRSMA